MKSFDQLKEKVSQLIGELTNAKYDALRSIASEITECLESKPIVEFKPSSDVVFVGDLHGDYESLLALRSIADNNVIVFLGDYVDRGPNQLECLLGVLLMKCEEPNRVIVLRGNHETLSMNAYYGFINELRKRFSNNWKLVYGQLVRKAYIRMPLVIKVLISEAKVFGCHGGPPITKSLKDLHNARLELEPEDDAVLEVLWSDPREGLSGILPSPRGAGYLYGKDVVEEFLEKYGFKFMVRAHEPVDGVLSMFDDKLYIVFTCRYYGIRPGVLRIHEDLTVEPVYLL